MPRPKKSSGVERPSLKVYTALVEVYRDQLKVSHTEASVWAGVSRATAEQAYFRGWRGDKNGNGALAPIKDVLERMKVGAVRLREQIIDSIAAQNHQELAAAIRDGMTQRALEGVASRGLFQMLREQMEVAAKMQSAAQPLVERYLSQLRTMSRIKALSAPEIKSELSFIQAYIRETTGMAESYMRIEKLRGGFDTLPPDQKSQTDKMLSEKTEVELIDSLHTLIRSVQKNLDDQTLSKKAKIIEVEATPVVRAIEKD